MKAKKKENKEKRKGQEVDGEEDGEKTSSFSSSSPEGKNEKEKPEGKEEEEEEEEDEDSDCPSSTEDSKESVEKEAEYQSHRTFMEKHASIRTPHLLGVARKMVGWGYSQTLRHHPVKFNKMVKLNNTMTIMEKERATCAVVRSCLVAVMGKKPSVTLDELMEVVASSHFPSHELELARRSIDILSVKDIVQRLEMQGEVDVTISKGEVCVALIPMQRGLSVDPVPEQKLVKGVPLKMMRKKKMYYSQHY